MKNESSLFTRAQYLEELADVAARPIGKETRLSVIVHFLQKEFHDLVNLKTGATCTERKSNAQLYEHKAYPQLFYEVAEIEMSDKKNPHQVAVYDFLNDKMLIATNYPSNVPEKPVQMNATVKSRLYENYNLNAFPYLPFDTIDGLLNQVPTNHERLRRSDEDAGKNEEQGKRTVWLRKYAEAMFDVKAQDDEWTYALPLFNNKNILCMKSIAAGEKTPYSMRICDRKQGRILNIHSSYETSFTMDGYRLYSINESSMTDTDITIAKNVLFLTEKNHILHPNTILDLNGIDLPNDTLPDIVDMETIPIIQPKNKL